MRLFGDPGPPTFLCQFNNIGTPMYPSFAGNPACGSLTLDPMHTQPLPDRTLARLCVHPMALAPTCISLRLHMASALHCSCPLGVTAARACFVTTLVELLVSGHSDLNGSVLHVHLQGRGFERQLWARLAGQRTDVGRECLEGQPVPLLGLVGSS